MQNESIIISLLLQLANNKKNNAFNCDAYDLYVIEWIQLTCYFYNCVLMRWIFSFNEKCSNNAQTANKNLQYIQKNNAIKSC